ncbi:hypothetical protein SAMN04487925_103515 [Bradyrhizobium sp. cf659]|nr:hypothetical protein SAMN04487925_103515 [Bradyrhizobium sp. cf659]
MLAWSVAARFEGEFSNVTRSYTGKGKRSLRLPGWRLCHALFAGQGTTCPDTISRSRPLSFAA